MLDTVFHAGHSSAASIYYIYNIYLKTYLMSRTNKVHKRKITSAKQMIFLERIMLMMLRTNDV